MIDTLENARRLNATGKVMDAYAMMKRLRRSHSARHKSYSDDVRRYVEKKVVMTFGGKEL